LQSDRAAAENTSHETVNGGGEAFRRILSLKETGEIKGIHGAVCDLFAVEAGYETAVSIAAGGKAGAIVVDDCGVAAACAKYLNDNRLGRVMLLPLDKLVPVRPVAKALMVVKQTLGFVKDHTKYDSRYAVVADYVFGDTLVTADIDKACAIMGGVRIVTLNGELFEKSGAIVAGSVDDGDVV